YGEGPELEAAAKRYMEFFNTHPYMAAPMIGAMLRIEESEGPEAADKIRIFKQRMMGIGGALGDPFYWRALRPLMGVVGVALAWLATLWSSLALLVPIVPLLLYNAVHIPMRSMSFFWGYRDGPNVIQRFRAYDFPRHALQMKRTAFLIACAVGGGWVGGLWGDAPETLGGLIDAPAPVMPLALGALVFVCHGLLRKGGPVESILLVLLAAVLLVAYLAGGGAP
ncbi:MAG: PTS system mannose/fructose/sorbose family transporter subunit IID, partial [Candidatus Methylomirabilis sp.]|nr:PTS system mannose/fructose/sorbose family transporter subunit IID [Deltaproteobacteria bacterium]